MSEIKPVAYISNDADLPLKEGGKYWLECEPSDRRTPLYPAATLEALQAENAELKEELDRERMRLTACGVAALENTKDCVDKRIGKDNPYYSGSYSSVCRAVDEEIRLRDENAAQAKRIEELEAATEHLGLTPQQAKDGLARHKAMREVMEAQRIAIRTQQEEIEALRKQVETAVDRINDMLQDDDGQAYKEARKFIESLAAQKGIES